MSLTKPMSLTNSQRTRSSGSNLGARPRPGSPAPGRSLLALALAMQAGVLGCQNVSQREAQIHPDPIPAAAPPAPVVQASPVSAANSEDTLSSANTGTTTVEVAGQRLLVTLADARVIKAALLARLRQSQVEDRDYLIKATEQVAPTIDQGVLRIGIWILQAQGGKLALTYRMPAGPEAAQAYRAGVTKEGPSWVVQDVVAGQIRVRR